MYISETNSQAKLVRKNIKKQYFLIYKILPFIQKYLITYFYIFKIILLCICYKSAIRLQQRNWVIAKQYYMIITPKFIFLLYIYSLGFLIQN